LRVLNAGVRIEVGKCTEEGERRVRGVWGERNAVGLVFL
jgi:hypothetical protein